MIVFTELLNLLFTIHRIINCPSIRMTKGAGWPYATVQTNVDERMNPLEQATKNGGQSIHLTSVSVGRSSAGSLRDTVAASPDGFVSSGPSTVTISTGGAKRFGAADGNHSCSSSFGFAIPKIEE